MARSTGPNFEGLTVCQPRSIDSSKMSINEKLPSLRNILERSGPNKEPWSAPYFTKFLSDQLPHRTLPALQGGDNG